MAPTLQIINDSDDDHETCTTLSNSPSMGGDDYAWLKQLPQLPVDEVFTLNDQYMEDPFTQKVNLSIGVYRTSAGLPSPFPSVIAAEKALLERNDMFRHEYLPAIGDKHFLELARELVFGKVLNKYNISSRVASVQTISGTGALHIAASFIAQFCKPKQVWISDPTWKNHHHIFDSVGIPQKKYPYLTPSGRTLDFKAMMETLTNHSLPGDVLLVQTCAHNPSGVDPSNEQWRKIAELCRQRKLLALFDCAYQGFASGDPVADAWSIQHFAEVLPNGMVGVAQSFSKNFGLYGQRVGALHFLLPRSNEMFVRITERHLVYIIRSEFSLSPRLGSTLVRTVLENQALREQWRTDLLTIHARILSVRTLLHDWLVRLKTPGSWNHIIEQVSVSLL